MNHDSCRKIDGNSMVGQNLAMSGSTAKFDDPRTIAKKAVDMWFNEISLVDQSDIDKLPEDL